MRYLFGFLCVCALGVAPVVGCSETAGTGGSGGSGNSDGHGGGNGGTGPGPATSGGPQIAIDPSGNALAVWAQRDDARQNIWSNRYALTEGWSTAERIETNDVDAGGPQIAIDPSGNALAVWVQWDGTRNNIWSNRYTPADGWSTAERIETNDADADGPQIAIDPSGNALAVWQQAGIWSNRYTPTDGWSTAERIETNDASADRPQIAIDPSGNALAVWRQWDGTRSNIWSNRYTPTDGWSTAERIETNDANADVPQIGIEPSGNALAVWTQWDGTRSNIWSNRYTPTDGWSTAERIETNDDFAGGLAPQIAIDPSGNALAVWDGIWSNRYTPTDGWGTAEELSDGGQSPQVAIDPSGNALVVWWARGEDGSTSNNIWSSRYTPTDGWGAAERIGMGGGAPYPQIAIDPNGNALAVWRHWDGALSHWSNRYTPSNGWGTPERIDAESALE